MFFARHNPAPTRQKLLSQPKAGRYLPTVDVGPLALSPINVFNQKQGTKNLVKSICLESAC